MQEGDAPRIVVIRSGFFGVWSAMAATHPGHTAGSEWTSPRPGGRRGEVLNTGASFTLTAGGDWLPLGIRPVAIAVAVGLLPMANTTALLPVDLLTPVGCALNVADGTSGPVNGGAVFGMIAAISAPLTALTAGRFGERRLAHRFRRPSLHRGGLGRLTAAFSGLGESPEGRYEPGMRLSLTPGKALSPPERAGRLVLGVRVRAWCHPHPRAWA